MQSVSAWHWRAGTIFACIVSLAIIATYGCPRAVATPPGGTSGWTQTFSDNFPGSTLNTNNWIPQATWTQNGQLYPSPNYNPSPYTPDCYYVPGNQYVYGNLDTLFAQSGSNDPPGGSSGNLPYSSAWLATKNFQQTYGYFECTMDASITQGDDTAFWMLNRNSWPPEIDVAELPGAPSVYWGSGGPYSAQGYGLDEALHGSSGTDGDWYSFPSGQNSGWAYHTYGVDWEPTYMSWYVDGNLIYTTTDTSNIPNVPMYMIVSMQIESDLSGGDWFGQAGNGSWPIYTYVSSVNAWLKNNSSLSAPTSVSATPGNQWVKLSWSKPSGATSFDIYRGTASGGESTDAIATDVTGTSFVDSAGLTNGTKYYYKVCAVNNSGASAMSSEANATPASNGAISYIQGVSCGGYSSTTNEIVDFQYPQIAGDLNVVLIGYNPEGGGGVSSVTDSAGNTYHQAIYPYGTGTTEEVIYYASNIAASSNNTITVNFDGTASKPDIQAMEFSGVSTLDKTSGTEGWSSSPSTPSVTTTAAKEVLVGGCVPATTISSLGSGYTAGPNDTFGYAGEYRIVSSTGSYSAGATLSGTAYWTMEMATFK